MKITRESVIKAVSNGMKPNEIVARLEQHASNGVPANVRLQVEDWSAWVRQVSLATLIAVRCPDSQTADRVMAVLKRRAERISATTIAVNSQHLTTADRDKLREHGILVADPVTANAKSIPSF